MSVVTSEISYQPSSSMDIDFLGESLYRSNEDNLPLNDHIKNLKVKTIYNTITKTKTKTNDKRQVLKLLSDLARSTDGLINNELRCKIWPILLGIEDDNNNNNNNNIGSTDVTSQSDKVPTTSILSNNKYSTDLFLQDLQCVELPPHKDEDQVKLDIQRSITILNHIQSLLYSGSSSYTTILTTNEIDHLKGKLSNLIIKLLRKYPSLNYYQGFHDIASIILLVCYIPNDKLDDYNINGTSYISNNNNNNNNSSSSNTINGSNNTYEDSNDYQIDEELAFKMLENLAIYHLRDYLISDINLSINHLRLIPTILEIVDNQLFQLIKQTSNSFIQSQGLNYDYKFYQALSSILTIYSHDLTNLSQILTLWDFSISYNSVLINMYIYVASLITFKSKIWQTLNILNTEDVDFSGIDPDIVHSTISSSNLFDGLTDSQLVTILNKSKELLEMFPIDELTNNETTWNKWFKQYNVDSVLCNTSKLVEEDEDLRLHKFNQYRYLTSQKQETETETETEDVNELLILIARQDEQISRQINDELIEEERIFQQLLAKQEEEEELSQSIQSIQYDDDDEELPSSSSSENLLSSSLTLANSITSSSIHRIKSTLLFRKFFHNNEVSGTTEEAQGVNHSTTTNTDNNDNDEKVIRDKNWVLSLLLNNNSNIYKISITIGFIGVVLHFLLIKSNNNNNNTGSNFLTTMIINPLKQFLQYEPLFTLSTIGTTFINDLEESFNGLIESSSIPNMGNFLGNIGNGNIRNTIYGFN